MQLLNVDFNSRDERGFVPAVGAARVGEDVDLVDDDGNHCMGRVSYAEADRLSINPAWATWADEGESRLVLAPQPGPWLSPRWLNPLTVLIQASFKPSDTSGSQVSAPHITNESGLVVAR